MEKLSQWIKPGFCLWMFLLTFNNLINFIPSGLHDKVYLPLNLIILFLIFLWSRKFLTLTNTDIGWLKQNLLRSILWGIGSALVIVIPFLFLLWIRPLLGLNIQPPQLPVDSNTALLWRIFLRIPLGTAFFEEILFRGILYGYLIKKFSANRTILLTSLVFLIWHITPAYKTISLNFHIGEILFGIGLWFIFLISSFIAGLLFGWIRYRSKNIAGSILSHALINSLALTAMFLFWSR